MQAAIEVRTRDSHSRFATLKIQFKHVISTLAYVTRVVSIIIILMLVTDAPKTFILASDCELALLIDSVFNQSIVK